MGFKVCVCLSVILLKAKDQKCVLFYKSEIITMFMQGTNLLNYCANLGFLFYLLFCLTLVGYHLFL